MKNLYKLSKLLFVASFLISISLAFLACNSKEVKDTNTENKPVSARENQKQTVAFQTLGNQDSLKEHQREVNEEEMTVEELVSTQDSPEADESYFLFPLTKENSIPEDYEPSDLVDVGNGKRIRQVVYPHLNHLREDAKGEGINLKIISVFRSYTYQKDLFERRVERNAIDAERFVAKPGHSEHQLGTTVDFGGGNPAIDLTAAFAETPQGRWLMENAWKYGFVMSYPESKEEITGYAFEPWHYRFIGRDEAEKFRASSLTLSEYLFKAYTKDN